MDWIEVTRFAFESFQHMYVLFHWFSWGGWIDIDIEVFGQLGCLEKMVVVFFSLFVL